MAGKCDVCWELAPGRCVVRLVATWGVGTVVVCGACASSLYFGTPLSSPIPANLWRQVPEVSIVPRLPPPAPRRTPPAPPVPEPVAPEPSPVDPDRARWGVCVRPHPYGVTYYLAGPRYCPHCGGLDPFRLAKGEEPGFSPPRPTARGPWSSSPGIRRADLLRSYGLNEDETPTYSLWPRRPPDCERGCGGKVGHAGPCSHDGANRPLKVNYFDPFGRMGRGSRKVPVTQSIGDTDEWRAVLYGRTGAVPYCLWGRIDGSQELDPERAAVDGGVSDRGSRDRPFA